MKHTGEELPDEWWDDLYLHPTEPCGCQDWSPEKTEDLPTQKPVAENPVDDDRCLSCGTVAHGNGHYCGSRGYV